MKNQEDILGILKVLTMTNDLSSGSEVLELVKTFKNSPVDITPLQTLPHSKMIFPDFLQSPELFTEAALGVLKNCPATDALNYIEWLKKPELPKCNFDAGGFVLPEDFDEEDYKKTFPTQATIKEMFAGHDKIFLEWQYKAAYMLLKDKILL